MKRLLLTSLLLSALLNASESTFGEDILTRTNISFNIDDNGNLNPSIFVPFYYGNNNQFFSGVGYSSGNTLEVDKLTNFSDSKNSYVSNSQDLLINYISYNTSLFGFNVSIGAQSTFSKEKNNEFGYIHDSEDVFGNGTDYYVAFDNSTELDIARHAIRADILLPFGQYFVSRLSTSISPYTSIGVKQSTIFKPLVSETGTSSSSTVQEISYNFRYEAQTNTGTFFNLGLVASYDYQPLKYELAQLANNGSAYEFETNTIDTTEVRTRYIVKVLFDTEVIGGLNPSFGYGIENLERKNNLTGETVSTDKTIFTLAVEKRF